jgi:anti-sigma regulatory factor (Ser/Thr protein kinase)
MPAPPAPRTAHSPAPSRPRPTPAPPPRAFLDLGAVLTAPGCARAWTRVILLEWRLTHLTDAELVVSELTSNAVLASHREGVASFRLILTLDQGEFAILVRDFCPGDPLPRQADDEDEGGRGLLLIQALSGRSGWYPTDDGTPGKVVWAVLSAETSAEAPSTPHIEEAAVHGRGRIDVARSTPRRPVIPDPLSTYDRSGCPARSRTGQADQ